MQMVPCPKCGAPNSTRRNGCFNCGTALRDDSVQPPVPPTAPDSGAAVPVVIGIFAGIFCLPFALYFLASDQAERRRYGVRMIIGLGIAIAVAMCWATFHTLRQPSGSTPSGPSAAEMYDSVAAGMTADQVISSCGEPDTRSLTETAPIVVGYTTYPGTRYEVWFYRGLEFSVTFQDGVVVNKSLN